MTGAGMTDEARSERAAGIALIGAAALGMLAMAHHPSSLRAGMLVQFVHGAMILFAGMMAFGFTHFARLRGLGQPAVLAGLVAYAIGNFASIGAAVVSGFAAPALAAEGAGHDALDILWAINQALAKLGAVAIGVAYVCWSLDLWRRSRLVALAGLLAGGVPALLLAGGWIGMHLHAAILVYGAQFLWAVLIGWLLLRGSLRPAEPSGD